MKRACLLVVILYTAISSYAQLLKTTPEFVQDNNSNIDIVCDANYGNKAILNYSPTADMYVHIGVIYNQDLDEREINKYIFYYYF